MVGTTRTRPLPARRLTASVAVALAALVWLGAAVALLAGDRPNGAASNWAASNWAASNWAAVRWR